jgi:biotin carboxyl carrier protein
MKITLRVSGPSGEKTHVVKLTRDTDRLRVALDGQPVDADAVQIAPHTISIILQGKSHEISITPFTGDVIKIQTGHQEFTAELIDPRAWHSRRQGALEVAGRQQILAPMPGKVVRLLVNSGDRVEAGQGLLVVEAMKMQNEIRSPKGGTVEGLFAKEGQPVNAGDVLAWVE